mmetsp:Transcript_63677/g.151850  ORF Transcript_63677/g.151850 Transcript_63677/m.151850 type:complete len:177 (+) Transcript_63677:110-640(+)
MAVVVRGAGGAGKVAISTAPSDAAKAPESKRAVLEKVNNTYGSVAGAGSNFFPIYRRHRNHELERLREMDKEYDQKVANEHFQERREALAAADEEATAKRAAKRQKKKDSRIAAKARAKNDFANDGSFLQTILEKNPEIAKAGEREHKVDPSVTQMPILSAQEMSANANMTIREVE